MPLFVLNLLRRVGKIAGINLEYFFTNGVWVTLRFGIIAAMGLVLSAVFTRLSTKETLGQYQLVISILGMFAFFSLPGMNMAVLKAVSQGNYRSIYTALRTTFRYGMLAIPIIAAYACYMWFWQGEMDLGLALLIAGLAFPFFYSPLVWAMAYDARLLFREHALRAIFTNVLTTTFLLVGIFVGGNVVVLIGLYLIANIACNWFFLREVLKGMNQGGDHLDTKYGIAVSFQKCVYNVTANFPAILVSHLLGIQFLASFYIANTFLNFLAGFLGGLSTLYLPLLFRYKRIAYSRVVLQNLAIGIGFFLAGSIFLLLFFTRLYGEAYRDSLSMAYWFMALIIIFPLRIFLVNFFTAQGKNALVIKSYLFANVLSAVVFLLVSGWGSVISSILYICLLHLALVVTLLVFFFVWQRQEKKTPCLETRALEETPC